MGITQLSLTRIEKYIHPDDNILILGCQNLYNTDNYGQVAHDYYADQGYPVRTIDIAGCQGSEVADLREDLAMHPEYSLILQHGTIEHIDDKTLYQAFKNIHEACAVDGTMIHENPKRGNWPGHGYHYFTCKFYEELAELCGYDLAECVEEPAMGNVTDGWNICAVLIKRSHYPFPGKTKFNAIFKKHVYAK